MRECYLSMGCTRALRQPSLQVGKWTPWFPCTERQLEEHPTQKKLKAVSDVVQHTTLLIFYKTKSALYLNDVVDRQNHFSPLYRVNRVLFQRPILLLQQTVKHRGNLRHLAQKEKKIER